MSTHDNRTPLHADLTDDEIVQQSSLMDCGQWGECDHNRDDDGNPTCTRRAVGWMRNPDNRDEVIELCDYHAGVDLSDHLRPNSRFERDKCDADGCSERWTDHRGWLLYCGVHASAFDLECDVEGITRHRLSPPPNPFGPQGGERSEEVEDDEDDECEVSWCHEKGEPQRGGARLCVGHAIEVQEMAQAAFDFEGK